MDDSRKATLLQMSELKSIYTVLSAVQNSATVETRTSSFQEMNKRIMFDETTYPGCIAVQYIRGHRRTRTNPPCPHIVRKHTGLMRTHRRNLTVT